MVRESEETVPKLTTELPSGDAPASTKKSGYVRSV
jgi:hypothetical protein